MATHKETKEAHIGESYGQITVTGIPETGSPSYHMECTCGAAYSDRLDVVKARGLTHCGCTGIKAGDTRGPFTVARQDGTRTRNQRARFVVDCECGKQQTVTANDWNLGKNPHRCWASMDMVGRSFGRLTVVRFTGERDSGNNYLWDTTCRCGGTKRAATVDLNRGNVRSCGCLFKEITSARAKARFPVTETPGYVTAHKRVTEVNGRADTHKCVECAERAQEWAYDGNDALEVVSQFAHKGLVYSLNPDHYVPMCKPCHGAFDTQMRANRKLLAA